MQALQFAICPDALALGFETKAAVGLILAADSHVTISGSMVFPPWEHHEGVICEKQGKRGRNPPVASANMLDIRTTRPHKRGHFVGGILAQRDDWSRRGPT